MNPFCHRSRVKQHVVVLLALVVLQAKAQIRIQAPEFLVSRFKATDGRIQGATATFGAPFYEIGCLDVLCMGPQRATVGAPKTIMKCQRLTK